MWSNDLDKIVRFYDLMIALVTSIWFFKSYIFILVLEQTHAPSISFHSCACSCTCFIMILKLTLIAPMSTNFTCSLRSDMISSKKKNFSSYFWIASYFCTYFSHDSCLSNDHRCWYLCHLKRYVIMHIFDLRFRLICY